MAKKKAGVGTLPHEIMMETWRKEGKVHREELSLKAIKLDHRLQAREKHLDLDHVKELHGYVKDGAVFPPIIVFRIDGKDFVGNGFHRCEVHKKEGRPSITADVVEGTWQEAVEFATCCNFANAALTPNATDKKKACFMLLDNGWLGKSPVDTAKHIGVSGPTVVKWRSEWCEKEGKTIPATTVDALGRRRLTRHKASGRLTITPAGNGVGFRFKCGGKRAYAATKAIAEAKLTAALEERSASLATLRSVAAITAFLASRSIYFDAIGNELKGMKGGACRGFAVSFISDDLRAIHPSQSVDAIVSGVGRVVLLAEHYDLARKVVLVFEPAEGQEIIVDIARRLGIEFMTLDEFVDAVKADEGAEHKDRVRAAGDHVMKRHSEVFRKLAES